MEKTVELFNFTPHTINVAATLDDNNVTHSFPSLGEVRCATATNPRPDYSYQFDVPVVDAPKFGEVQNIPNEKDNGRNGIIVSMVAAQGIVKNPEVWSGPVFAPDTGPGSIIRDEEGTILAVRRLCLYKE